MRQRITSVRTDANFFEKYFEPERKKLEMKLGVNISQPKFTQMISGFKYKPSVIKQNKVNLKNNFRRRLRVRI